MTLNAIRVEITEEDEMWGSQQNRWACAIVRAVQRQHPEAVYVAADNKSVRFTVPEDGENGIRYTFGNDKEMSAVNAHVIKPFDLERKIDPEYKEFSLTCVKAEPMRHHPVKGNSPQKRASNRKYRKSQAGKPKANAQTNRFFPEC